MTGAVGGDGGGTVVRAKGRPRDTDADARIVHAAAEIFSADGWRGFTLEAVARAAGVGKSTIYLRWESREELILDVLHRQNGAEAATDHGNIRDDLRALAAAYGRTMETPAGPVGVRLFLESFLNPEFAQVSAGLRRTALSDAHRIVRRARRRGQLRPGTSAAVLLDGLFGAVMHHLATVDAGYTGRLYDSPAGQAFLDRLVDCLLDGVGAPGG